MKTFCFLLLLFTNVSICIGSVQWFDSFEKKSQQLLYDTGESWHELSLFNIYLRSNFSKKENYSPTKIMISGNNSYSLLYKQESKKYQNFFIFFYPSYGAYVLKNKNLLKYSKEKPIPSFKNFASGFGFKNNWAHLQVSHNSEDWGAGNDISLGLTYNSEQYDYITLSSDYGNVRVKYIHGFLESINSYNRFLVAKGLELTNKRSLVFGISETVIYSGNNRSFDIGYLNPISSHLELELNNRLNFNGGNNANAIWQIHVDYLIKSNLRFSINYLFDEFVLDQDIETNKEHGKAFSLRFAYTPNWDSENMVTFFASMIHIGTPTFRHNDGMNNFVYKNNPIGYDLGSDVHELRFGLNLFDNKRYIFKMYNRYFEIGEENILQNSYARYKDYLKDKFPSGKVIAYNSTYFNLEWKLKDLNIFLEIISFHKLTKTLDHKDIFNCSLIFPLKI